MSETFSPPPTSKETLVNDPGMHHGTCMTHVPWCMSGSLTRGGGVNVPGIPGACATRNFTYLTRGPCKKKCNKILLEMDTFLECIGPFESIHGIFFGFLFRQGAFLPNKPSGQSEVCLTHVRKIWSASVVRLKKVLIYGNVLILLIIECW